MAPLKDRVRKLRKQLGLSQAALAELAGVTQNAIAAIENGHTKKSKFLPEIARALGVRLADLDSTLADNNSSMLNGERSPALVGEKDLPVYAAAEGGKGAMVLSNEAVDYTRRPAPLANVKDGYGIIVVGDSMFPAFEVGDILLVHPHLPCIPDTDVILYCEENGTVTVMAKRLRRITVEHWHLTQWNPAEGEKKDFTLSRVTWPICHRIVGKYSRR
jgi:transcriptional regulator with XRE-family HTH domain